jgi:tetratricopeptide (TPR) repeat protein
MHRKHGPELQAFACEASRTERGAAFAEGAVRNGKVPLDPCAASPVTIVGKATAWMGRGAASRKRNGGAARPDVERLLTQGLALLHSKQEHVHLAKRSIERAQKLAREAAAPRLQARAFVLRARLAAMQGRPEQTVTFTKRAEALIGPSPVLDRVRGDAYARVWRWTPAAAAYQRVAEAAPLDYRAWRDLARAYGSVSDDRNALDAANAGLRLAPRDESLLRSRALALASLEEPGADRARQRWLAHRDPDAQPALLASCERAHQRCRRDRQPIPHYTLTPPTKPIHASVDPG